MGRNSQPILNAYENDEKYHEYYYTSLGTPAIDRSALNYMSDMGYVLNVDGGGTFRITAHGRQYWEQINTWGPWYWYKNNWFPATVAMATIMVGISTIAVQVWRVLSLSCP